MVMGIDQTRHHDVLRGVKRGGNMFGRCLAGCHQLYDPSLFNDNTAFGTIGKDRQRIANPQTGHVQIAFSWVGSQKKPAPGSGAGCLSEPLARRGSLGQFVVDALDVEVHAGQHTVIGYFASSHNLLTGLVLDRAGKRVERTRSNRLNGLTSQP